MQTIKPLYILKNMENDSKIIELDTRVSKIELDMKSIWDKLRGVEAVQKTEATELSGLKTEMKEVKATLAKISKTLENLSAHDLATAESMKSMKKWIKFLSLFIAVVFVYIAIKDSETAKGILQLTATLAPTI